jgi:hypothetical protein
VPFLTMVSVATAGWLMERQALVARSRIDEGLGDPTFFKAKRAVARYFLQTIVTEALAHQRAATAGAAALYSLSADELAA